MKACPNCQCMVEDYELMTCDTCGRPLCVFCGICDNSGGRAGIWCSEKCALSEAQEAQS